MPLGKPKDKRLIALKREIADLEKLIAKEKEDPNAKAFREKQLARAKRDLAKHLQDNPE